MCFSKQGPIMRKVIHHVPTFILDPIRAQQVYILFKPSVSCCHCIHSYPFNSPMEVQWSNRSAAAFMIEWSLLRNKIQNIFCDDFLCNMIWISLDVGSAVRHNKTFNDAPLREMTFSLFSDKKTIMTIIASCSTTALQSSFHPCDPYGIPNKTYKLN